MRTLDSTALRLAAVVASSDDAIISHTRDGIIETWNRGAERMFGYTADEAIGLAIALIIPAAAGVPALPPPQGGTAYVDTIGRRKDGIPLDISVATSAILTPDGEFVGISRIIRDVTEQHALQREAFRLKAIVDSSEDAIISKNLQGRVQTWNKAAERLFGYCAEEMVGQPITKIIPPDRLEEESSVLSRVRAGLAVEHFETIRRHKDGSDVEISLTVSPIKSTDGSIIGASKIARDISLQRRLARDAEEASRVKDEFLGTLSHELRTPLNAVLGYTRMLRDGHFSDGRETRAIETIERNAAVLSQLVSDVLDVSSIVTGKMQLKRTPCDLASLMRAACDMVQPSADAKDVQLRVTSDARAVLLTCDGDRIQQVLWNLLSNAVKFTPAGGRVTAHLGADDRSAVITVSDTGIGIPAKALPYVFQRFWRGESAEERQTGGLGLGLALARHFTELHGGTISVASDGPGRGATFTVSLPALRSDYAS